MKAAVIGGSGFLGTVLCRALAAAGHSVISYDRATPEAPVPAVQHCSRDVMGSAWVFEEVPECIFYLAQSPDCREFPGKAGSLFGVNTHGVATVLEAAIRNGARAFFYASSGTVYQPSLTPLPEGAPLNRSQPYALSKIQAEELLALCRDRITATALRLFGLFGPGQSPGSLPARLCRSIEEGKAIELFPSGDEPDEGLCLSFLFVEDAARMLVALAELAPRMEMPPVVNVAGPEGVSLKRFAETVGKVVGRDPVFAAMHARRDGDYVADVSLLHRLISPACTGLTSAIQHTYAVGAER